MPLFNRLLMLSVIALVYTRLPEVVEISPLAENERLTRSLRPCSFWRIDARSVRPKME